MKAIAMKKMMDLYIYCNEVKKSLDEADGMLKKETKDSYWFVTCHVPCHGIRHSYDELVEIRDSLNAEYHKAISDFKTSAQPLVKAIHDAEGRSSVRLLTPELVCRTIMDAENRLFVLSTKGDAYGTTIRCDPNAQTFPRAYKYKPESTHFSAEYTKTGWKVDYIVRDTCWPSNKVVIDFTDDTKAHMAARMSTL